MKNETTLSKMFYVTSNITVSTEYLSFGTWMNNSKFAVYALKIPTAALNNFRIIYPKLFTDFNEVNRCLNIFKEMYKLLCLIVTFPSVNVSVEQSFSSLKRVKTYLRNTMLEEWLTNLSKIAIKKDLLKYF